MLTSNAFSKQWNTVCFSCWAHIIRRMFSDNDVLWSFISATRLPASSLIMNSSHFYKLDCHYSVIKLVIFARHSHFPHYYAAPSRRAGYCDGHACPSDCPLHICGTACLICSWCFIHVTVAWCCSGGIPLWYVKYFRLCGWRCYVDQSVCVLTKVHCLCSMFDWLHRSLSLA